MAEGSGLMLSRGWRSFQEVKGKGLLRGRWEGGQNVLLCQVLAPVRHKCMKRRGEVAGAGWRAWHRGAADLEEEH